MRFPWKMGEAGGMSAHRCRAPGAVALALSLALAGCSSLSTEEFMREGGIYPAPLTTLSENGSEKGTDKQSDSKEEKPESRQPPRTLPAALHAYLHCLRCGPPPEKNGQGNGEARSGSKTSNDDSDRQKNGKKPANGDSEKTESKSPPAEGQKSNDQEKEANGNKEADKDNDKESKNGDKKDKEDEAGPAWLSAHAQATMVTQIHDVFRSPYIGPHSLLPDEPSATSLTATLFLAARLWENEEFSGELVFNPELAGGRGFSGVAGVAGFPNGEITRVGTPEPTPYFARLYLRQTLGLGGEQETVEDGPNQIAGKRDIERLTLIVGKLAAEDFVDDNRYSHDPRTQFLPWSMMYTGAWDYPANVRGYTYGVAVDWNHKDWALRYGIFAEPAVANGTDLDPHILDANGQVLELEERYTLRSRPGKLRLDAYLNHAHMGKYRLALAEMPVDPDITATRSYRFKYGFFMSLEQELTKDLGLFVRGGWNDGQSESWAFTEIDQTAGIGLALKGRCWCRPRDVLGLAVVVNGISDAHRDYLAAGGIGFILGDGRLNYGPEEILETYYDFSIRKGIDVTAGFQEVNNPAYNRDRGPVSIGTLRVHIEF